MKKELIMPIICAFLVCAPYNRARAETCDYALDSTLPTTLMESQIEGIQFRKNCLFYQYMHYYQGGREVAAELRCTLCYTGSLITLSHDTDDIDTGANCEGNGRYAVVCAKPCDSSCKSDTYWINDNPGVEIMTYRQCGHSNKVCLETNFYQCAAGYFGSATDDTDNCTTCAAATGNNTAKSLAGAQKITECYLPSGSHFSDSTGSGQYTAKCYYTN